MIGTSSRAASPRAPRHRALAGVERLIAGVLFWGGLLSVALVLAGLVLHLGQSGLRGPGMPVPEEFRSLRAVVAGLRHHPLDPLALAMAGILLLGITPVLGVAVAIPAFVRAGDRRYATIAAIVLALLILGFLLAGGG